MKRSETEHSTRGSGKNVASFPAPLLEQAPEAMRTFMDQSAKLQSELLTLCGQRAQAWLNWPKQMLACKNVTDVVDAEGAFLTTMQRHYREYFDSVMYAVEAHRNAKDKDAKPESTRTQTSEREAA